MVRSGALRHRHQSGQAFGRTLVARLNYGTIRVLAGTVGPRRQDHITLVDVRVEKVVPPWIARLGFRFDWSRLQNRVVGAHRGVARRAVRE